jgi:flagellar basal-body rod protein FlgC
MANVDTPGYHTKDMDFQSAMQQAMNEGTRPQWSRPRRRCRGAAGASRRQQREHRPRKLLLSQTQLQYQMGVQLVKSEFHKLLTAIKGGKLTMGLFDMMSISASALSAERQRAEVTSANLANAETTHTDRAALMCARKWSSAPPNGSPFRTVFNGMGGFRPGAAGSVKLTQVVDDTTPPVMRYEPGNPDADKSGYVAYPAINPVSEMVDLMGAVRAYQLNASAVARPSR